MSTDLLPYVEVNTGENPQACVIWLHGLGDSGNGFSPIVPELNLPASMPVRFLFPHAPERAVTINNGMVMRAWYDIKTFDLDNRADLEGVLESMEQVNALVEAQHEAGFAYDKIVLAGFSQGGVIALHLGTRIQHKIAGIMALSTYMCKPELLADEAAQENKATPIMMAHGVQDPVVPMALGKMAFDALEQNGFSVTWQTYTMQHSVCLQEVEDISAWLQKVLA